jgi:HEAT repeat protein
MSLPGGKRSQPRGDGDPLAALATQLRHGDWRKRATAARNLGATRDPHAVAPLLGAMGDRDARVRLAVVRACGVHRSSKLIRVLRRGLADNHRKVRIHAVRSLARVGTREAAVVLLEGLDGASMWLRPEVADALVAMDLRVVSGLKAATGILVAELDPRQRPRFARLSRVLAPALRALLRQMQERDERNQAQSLSSNWTVQANARRSKRDDRTCRSGPCRALADMGPKVLYLLLPLARAGVPGVHSRHLYLSLLPPLLKRLGVAAIPHLIALMGKSYGENVLATGALSELGGATVKPLGELLRLGGRRVGARMIAARLLGEIRDPQVTAMLVAALEDSAPEVSKAAIGALMKNLTAKTVGVLTQKFKSGSEGQRLAMVMAALKQTGALANRLLIGAIVWDGGEAAREAASALGDRKVRAAVPALLGALGRPSVKLREVVLDGLGRIRDPRAFKVLARFARRGSKRLRLVAIRALGDLGTRSAAQVLRRLKRSRNETLSKAAASALIAIKRDRILTKYGAARVRVVPCDRYLVALACTLGRTPASKRGAALKAFHKTYNAWKKIAAQYPLAGLAGTCRSTLAAWKKTASKHPRYRGCFSAR